MTCAWNQLLTILPPKYREQVDKNGREDGQELRFRLDKSPMLIKKSGCISLMGNVLQEDLQYVVNMTCRYSPWTSSTVANGYLTATGGHRIGLSGEALIKNDKMDGIRTIHSLNIRIARDFSGIAGLFSHLKGSVLVIGPPGSGKTTLLRDLIRQRSFHENVSVVDERGELFPVGFDKGLQTDILVGCRKPEGMQMLLRTMTPDSIAVDEITAEEDIKGILNAAWCGVSLLATAHASDIQDLSRRPIYRPLLDSKIFHNVIIMQKDKTFRLERVNI